MIRSYPGYPTGPVAETVRASGSSAGATRQLFLTSRVTAAPGGQSGLTSSIERVLQVGRLIAGGGHDHHAPLLRVAGR